MITTKLFDSEEGVTYSLIFSEEDAQLILSAPNNQLVQLPSIEGNIVINNKQAKIVYKNGSSGMGSIFTNYNDLCNQL